MVPLELITSTKDCRAGRAEPNPPDTISARLLKVALAVVDIASVVFGGSVEVVVTDVIVVVDVVIMDIQVLFKFSTKNM